MKIIFQDMNRFEENLKTVNPIIESDTFEIAKDVSSGIMPDEYKSYGDGILVNPDIVYLSDNGNFWALNGIRVFNVAVLWNPVDPSMTSFTVKSKYKYFGIRWEVLHRKERILDGEFFGMPDEIGNVLKNRLNNLI
jgi:hypothetical protein